jgi:hypothetical protein
MTWAESDGIRKWVPIVLGLGVLALFVLPNMSQTIDDGWSGPQSENASFSQVRRMAAFYGVDGVLWAGLTGVAIAVVSALAMPADGTAPRKLIVGFGAVSGLLYPIGLLLPAELPASETFGMFSWGIYVFAAACMAGALITFLEPDESLQSLVDGTSSSRYTQVFSSGTTHQRTPLKPAEITNGPGAEVSSGGNVKSWSIAPEQGIPARTVSQTSLRGDSSDGAETLETLFAGKTLTIVDKGAWDRGEKWIPVILSDGEKQSGYVDRWALSLNR